MSAEPTPPPETVTAEIAMTVAGNRLETTVTVPTAPTPMTMMLPVFQSLADTLIGSVVRSVEAQGRKISCCAGCGACCRQLVPITDAEARRIRDLVESFPEPRRSTVKARFAAAKSRLEETGLLKHLLNLDEMSADQRRSLGLDYFKQQIPCPFLEDESCSIHRDRPLVCREYLVTSHPRHCATLTDEKVEGVMMPAPLWAPLARIEEHSAENDPFHWVPLVLAPEWADAHPDGASARPGPEWVQEFFERLSGAAIPAPTPGMMGSTGTAEGPG